MSDCYCTKHVGKAPCIHDYHQMVADLKADIAAVRELHYDDGDGWCNHCMHRKYPCLTIRALNGELDTPDEPAQPGGTMKPVIHEPECPFVGRDKLTDCLFCIGLRGPKRGLTLKNIKEYLSKNACPNCGAV